MAITERQTDTAEIPYSVAEEISARNKISPIARLAALHAEAETTSRLANLLGRSILVAGVLVVLAGLTITAGAFSLNASLAWAGLVVLGVGAMALAYRQSIASPFSRESLEAFARVLTPITLYCGVAWGAGAFLVLPTDTSLWGTAFFVGAPAFAVAGLLRAREPVLTFVVPMLALSVFAALLRPLPDATLAVSVMLVTGALVAAVPLLLEHRRAMAQALPPTPIPAS